MIEKKPPLEFDPRLLKTYDGKPIELSPSTRVINPPQLDEDGMIRLHLEETDEQMRNKVLAALETLNDPKQKKEFIVVDSYAGDMEMMRRMSHSRVGMSSHLAALTASNPTRRVLVVDQAPSMTEALLASFKAMEPETYEQFANNREGRRAQAAIERRKKKRARKK